MLIKELDEKAARNTKNDQNDQTTRLTRHQKDMIVKARESGFNSSMKLIERRKQFESSIRRPYFHPKPLDSNQLSNWRSYLDFEISESVSARRVTTVTNNFVLHIRAPLGLRGWFVCSVVVSLHATTTPNSGSDLSTGS